MKAGVWVWSATAGFVVGTLFAGGGAAAEPASTVLVGTDRVAGTECAFSTTSSLYLGVWDAPSKTCSLVADVAEKVQLTTDGVVLDCAGHRVTGTGGGDGVSLSDRANVVVRNCDIRDFTYGLVATSASNVTLDGNTVTSARGVQIEDGSGVTLSGNRSVATESGHPAIALVGGSGFTFIANDVRDASVGLQLNGVSGVDVGPGGFIFGGHSDGGIQVVSSTDVTVHDLVLGGSDVSGSIGVEVVGGSGVTVRSTSLTGWALGVHALSGSASLVLDGNTVTSARGIRIEDGSGVTLSGNRSVATEPGHPAIALVGGSGFTFIANDVRDASVGLQLNGVSGVNVGPGGFVFGGHSDGGIQVVSSTDVTVHDLVLGGSDVSGSIGVEVVGGSGVTVRSTSLTGWALGVHALSGSASLVLDGNTVTSARGIRIEDGSGVTLSGNRSVATEPGHSAIALAGGSGFTFIANDVRDASVGLQLSGVSGVDVGSEGFVFGGHSDGGVQVVSSNDVTVHDVVLGGSDVSSSVGVEVVGGSGVTVRSTLLAGWTHGVHALAGSDSLVLDGNTVTSARGIRIEGGSGVTLSGNRSVATEPGHPAITLVGGSGFTFIANDVRDASVGLQLSGVSGVDVGPEGFTFGGNTDHGIQVISSTDVMVHDLVVGGTDVSGSVGVKVTGGSGVTVRSTLLTGWTHGVHALSGSDSLVLDGNTVTSARGIRIEDGSRVTLSGNRSVATEPRHPAIALVGGSGFTFIANDVRDASVGLQLSGVSGVDVGPEGFTFGGNTDHGIQVISSADVTVHDLVVDGTDVSGSVGVKVTGGSGVTVRSTLLTGWTHGVHALSGSDSLVLDGNTVTSARGILIEGGSGVTLTSNRSVTSDPRHPAIALVGGSGFTFTGNDVRDSSAGLRLHGVSGVDVGPEGFTFGGNGNRGIQVISSTDVTVHDLIVGGSDVGGSVGVEVVGGSGVTVRSTSLTGWALGVHALSGSASLVLDGNTVTSARGIRIEDGSGVTLSGNRSVTTEPGHPAIALAGGSGFAFVANDVRDASAGLQLHGVSGVEVAPEGFTFGDNQSCGIQVISSADVTIRDLDLRGNAVGGSIGVQVLDSSGVILRGNTISRWVTGLGLQAGSSGNQIFNNLFSNVPNNVTEDSGLTNSFFTDLTPLETGTNVVGGPNLGGNFWGSPAGDGFSETCPDADEPQGICDAVYVLPSGSVDELPLTLIPPADEDSPEITVLDDTDPLPDGLIVNRPVVPVVSVADASEVVVESSLNGVLFTSGSSVAGEGAYELVVEATDTAGNAASLTVRFTIDLTAPEVTLVEPGAPVIVDDATPRVVFDFADALGGVDASEVEVLVDGEPITIACGFGISRGVCASPELGAGIFTVRVEVPDRAGNLGVAEGSFELQLDTEPPTLTVTGPIGTVINDPTPTLSLELSDVGSGLDPPTLQVTLDGADITASCTLTGTTAVCEPPVLEPGSHRLQPSVRDIAGNLGLGFGEFELILDTDPPTFSLLSPVVPTVLEGTFPGEIAIGLFDEVSALDPATLQVELDGGDITASCVADESTVVCPVSEPAVGPHAIAVSLADVLGNLGSASLLFEVAGDTRLPTLSIVSPAEAVLRGDATPAIELEYSDRGVGVALETLAVGIDGADITPSCEVQGGGAICEAPLLASGFHTVTASIEDGRGNRSVEGSTFEIELALPIAIVSPQGGLLTRSETVTVSGSVALEAETVAINGVEVLPAGGAFTAEVALHEGNNTLTAVARTVGGGSGTATVNVVRDTTAPVVVVETPRDGLVTASPQILVTGTYNDASSSNVDLVEATVSINGLPAEVRRNTFVVESFLLQPGENRVTVEATDMAGNRGSTEITVVRLPEDVPRLEELLGNGQRARVGGALAKPLVVRVVDGLGRPLVGREVEFAATRGAGKVELAGEAARSLSVVTNERGLAQVGFVLGERAGSGNQEVTVSSPGIDGEVVFCASADPGPPVRIVAIGGTDNAGAMAGEVGRAYPKPLLSQVFDAKGNPVAGVPVTYRAVSGGGSFGGAATFEAETDDQGVTSAVFSLGSTPGINVNLVEARFPELEQVGAVFTLSGLLPAAEAATAVAGVVLDNEDQPVPGATLRIAGTSLEGVSDAQGRFRIAGAPVGTVHLDVDGSTVTRPGSWPSLSFELITVAGQGNGLGKPIRLLPINEGFVVGGDEDVVIPMPEVPGASLTVFANSVTFGDGAKTGAVSFTQIHTDKVPMVAPLGSSFAIAFTVQPPGTRFDPPAQIAIPNVGDPPGKVVEIYSFDHDLGEFITAGPATVTEDGLFLRSNPGFGISKSGWGGCVSPKETGDACTEGACNACGPDGFIDKCGECEQCAGAEGCQPKTVGAVQATARLGARSSSEELVVGVGTEVLFQLSGFEGRCAPEERKASWDFADGETGEGHLVSHAFEAEGIYTVTLGVSCGECTAETTATVEIQVATLDLEMQSLPEEDDESVPPDEGNEEEPGAFVLVNDDDDQDGAVEGEPAQPDDDLVELKIGASNLPQEGEIVLEVEEEEGEENEDDEELVRIWVDAEKSEEIPLPMTWDLAKDEQPPERVFVEGWRISEVGEVGLRLSLVDEEGLKLAEDVVRVTVLGVLLLPDEPALLPADDPALPPAIVVTLLDGEDVVAVEDGAEVEWTVVEGAGAPFPPLSMTEDGVAETEVPVPTVPGTGLQVRAEIRSLGVAGRRVALEGLSRLTGKLQVVPGSAADLQIVQSATELAADGLSEVTLELTARDAFGNLVEDGSGVFWEFEGLGEVLALEKETLAGRASATVQAGFVIEQQIIRASVDSATAEANVGMAEVQISLATDRTTLDVATGEKALLTASFVGPGGLPVPDGSPIFWMSSNGRISGADVVQGGVATAVLDATDAWIGETRVVVGLNASHKSLALTFTSSAETVMELDQRIIASDATEPGFVSIEQADGSFVQEPFSTSSVVTVRGAPGAVFRPSVESFGTVASYGFDEITDGTVVDRAGGHHGSVLGASLDEAQLIAGIGSLAFDGSSEILIDAAPSLEFSTGIELSLWVRPAALAPGVLVAKDGEYSLSLDIGNRPVFAVETLSGPVSVAAERRLAVDEWSRVRARFDGGRLLLTVNDHSTDTPIAELIQPTANAIRVGDGFQGRLDELTLAARAPSTNLVELVGLNGSGQIVLDGEGNGSFTVRSLGALSDATDVRTLDLVLTADPLGASSLGLGGTKDVAERLKTALVIMTKTLVTYVVNYHKGFLLGNGEGLGGFAGDFAAGLVFYGDARDIVVQTARLVGGKDPDYLTLSFAVVGLLIELVPFAGVPAGGLLSSAKVVLKKIAKFGAGQGKVIPVIFMLVTDTVSAFQKHGLLAASRLLLRRSEALKVISELGDDSVQLLEQAIKSPKFLDDFGSALRKFNLPCAPGKSVRIANAHSSDLPAIHAKTAKQDCLAIAAAMGDVKIYRLVTSSNFTERAAKGLKDAVQSRFPADQLEIGLRKAFDNVKKFTDLGDDIDPAVVAKVFDHPNLLSGDPNLASQFDFTIVLQDIAEHIRIVDDVADETAGLGQRISSLNSALRAAGEHLLNEGNLLEFFFAAAKTRQGEGLRQVHGRLDGLAADVVTDRLFYEIASTFLALARKLNPPRSGRPHLPLVDIDVQTRLALLATLARGSGFENYRLAIPQAVFDQIDDVTRAILSEAKRITGVEVEAIPEIVDELRLAFR